jgi:hypothetical protein
MWNLKYLNLIIPVITRATAVVTIVVTSGSHTGKTFNRLTTYKR